MGGQNRPHPHFPRSHSSSIDAAVDLAALVSASVSGGIPVSFASVTSAGESRVVPRDQLQQQQQQQHMQYERIRRDFQVIH